jgi:surfeit locus 1 family protein
VKPPVAPATFDAELSGSSIDAVQYRRVEVTGTYDTAGEVAVRGRTLNGAPGRWVATPIRPTGGGTPILVMRGFIPQAVTDTTAPFAGAEPPAGEVTVVGWALPTQTKGTFGSTDAASGRLDELSRVDVARVAQQYGPLEPYWLQLSAQRPESPAKLLSPVPLPDPDNGPHLGYAVQWAIFTLIAIAGYPLVLRKVARQRLIDGDDEDQPGTGAESESAGV